MVDEYSLTIETDDPGEAGRILQVLQALGGGASPPEAARPQVTSVEPEAARMVEALTSPPLTSGQKIILLRASGWRPIPMSGSRSTARTRTLRNRVSRTLSTRRGDCSASLQAALGAPSAVITNMPRAPLRLLAEYRVDGRATVTG